MGIKKKIFPLRLVLIYLFFLSISYLIYKPAFSSYFFQDDWFTFKISQANSVIDIFRFFIPRTDVIYFRPLGMQVYFFLMNLFFGVKPIFFRLSSLVVYSLNGLLVYLLLLKLKISPKVSFLGGTLYTGSAVTYIPFFWSATFPFILAPTFFLVSLLFFIKKPKTLLREASSFFFFICGLLTLEIVIFLPLILIIWELLFNKAKSISRIIFYFFPLIPYLYLRTIAFPAPLAGSYTLEVKLLSTLRTYLLWTFNWPEEISRQMVGFFTINLQFLNQFHLFIILWTLLTISICILAIILPLIWRMTKLIQLKCFNFEKTELFGFVWFLITLLPLLLFSKHIYPYYLPIPLVGFLIYLSSQVDYLFKYLIMRKIPQFVFIGLISTLWVSSSLITMKFNQLTHWAPRTACFSKQAVDKIMNFINETNYRTIRVNDPDYKLALNDQDAFQVLLKNPDVKTIYGSDSKAVTGQELVIYVSKSECGN